MTPDEKPLALATAALFIISFMPALVGGVMFMGRKQLHWAQAQSRQYLFWERGMWVAGIIVLTGAFSVFAALLQQANENVLSRLGLVGFLFGAFLIVVAEVYALDTQTWLNFMVRLSVILLLLSEAVLGGAVTQVQLLPQWVGWVTIIWNIGWFILLVRAKDPYFPAIHYIMPLVVGIILFSLAN